MKIVIYFTLLLSLVIMTSCDNPESVEVTADQEVEQITEQGVIIKQGYYHAGFCPDQNCEPSKLTGTYYLVSASEAGNCSVLDSAVQNNETSAIVIDTLHSPLVEQVCVISKPSSSCAVFNEDGLCQEVTGPCPFIEKFGIPESLGNCYQLEAGQFTAYNADLYAP